MSYADRLNNFNNAISTANEHVKNMRDTLSNPELRENPVRFGLDTAGQVLGTGEGITRIVSQVREGDVQRNVANAFFNRLGDLKKGSQSLSNSVGSNTREALQNVTGRARQTVASATADAQPTRLTQSSQLIQENRGTPTKLSNPSRADLSAEDGGLADRIGGFPQSIIRASDEANEINNSINSKIRGGLTGNERESLANVANESLGDFNEINRIPVGQGKADALRNYLSSKNNIANDVLARKTQGLNPAKGYDTTGNPLGEDSTIIGKARGAGVSARADADGTANAGSNAGQTLGKAPATNNATAGLDATSGGDASNQGLSAGRRVGTQIGDIQDAGTATRATVDDGANIVSRGRALNLLQSLVPSQGGGGTVQGLSTVGNAGGDANVVSLAQHVNSAQAQMAQAVGNQVDNTQSGARGLQAGLTGASADTEATTTGGRSIAQSLSTNAGRNADEEGGTSAGRGIARALAGEESLDALAPETGALAPILEAGSLLATLGTGIASLFEPEEKKESTAPPPVTDSGFSIGANLKGGGGGAVGAF